MPVDPIASSGRRNWRIEIQELTESIGTSGEPIESWSTLCYAWAHTESVDAPERFTEGMLFDQITARAWHTFKLRYFATLDPLLVAVPKTRRVRLQGRIYDIAAAKMIEWKKQVELLTISKVG